MSDDPSENIEQSSAVETDTVYIGNKPPMSYVMATIFQFNQGTKTLTFKARGRAISRAVDVVEITRRRFLKDKLVIKDITIDTETVGESEDLRNVSSIEITVELLE